MNGGVIKYKSWILLGIILLGLALRLYSIDYGFPFIVGPDEKRQILDALSMGARHSFIPAEYSYPALHKYILLVGFGLYFFVGYLFRVFSDTSDFVFKFLVNPGSLFLVGRLVSVFFGVLIIIPVYSLGKRIFTKITGIIAGIFSMFMVSLVIHSQWATADIMLAFVSTCALYYIIKSVSCLSKRDLILSGIFIGLAGAIKYQGAYLVVPFLTMILVNFRRGFLEKKMLPTVGLSLFFMGLIALAGNLSFIFSFDESVKRFMELKNETMGISSMAPFANNLVSVIFWFIRELIRQELLLGVVLITSMGYSIYKHKKEDLVFLSYLFICLFSLVSFGFRSLHILVYSFPIVCVFGARFIERLIEMVFKEKYKVSYSLLCASLIVLPSISRGIAADIKRSNPDTRILARHWVEKNIPSQTKIAQDWYDFALPLYCEYPVIFADDKLSQYYLDSVSQDVRQRYADFVRDKPAYKLLQIRYETEHLNWPKSMPLGVVAKADKIPLVKRLYKWFNFRSVDELIDRGVSYVVISSYSYNHFLFDDDPRKKTGLFNPFIFEDTLASNKQAKYYIEDSKHGLLFFLARRARDFYLPLLDYKDLRVKLVKEISPGENNLGPVIKIYKINKGI
ncbi:MAG: glycosyltransferase family 39 protein [Candidatus Omnitrophota bacterium]|nr:glycosyltransferase family 39 protein [Candidatus Omnitrophota bacterium]